MLKQVEARMNSYFFQKSKYFAFIILLSAGLSNFKQTGSIASDLRLVMFTSKDCPVCQAWEREVGSVYKKSHYQVALPLTRVNFSAGISDLMSLQEPIIGTPTFVILRNGEEEGRILGFNDTEIFWWELSSFVQ